MQGAVFTSDPFDGPGDGSRCLAVTCEHARTVFLYCPAAVPPALRLSEQDAARLVIIRHEAAEHCGCTAALNPLPAAG